MLNRGLQLIARVQNVYSFFKFDWLELGVGSKWCCIFFDWVMLSVASVISLSEWCGVGNCKGTRSDSYTNCNVPSLTLYHYVVNYLHSSMYPYGQGTRTYLHKPSNPSNAKLILYSSVKINTFFHALNENMYVKRVLHLFPYLWVQTDLSEPCTPRLQDEAVLKGRAA